MHGQEINYAVAFSAGMFSFLSPCVLPLIPSYVMFITGISFQDLQASHQTHLVRREAFLNSLFFVLGFTIIFALLGASATLIGSLLQQHTNAIRKIGGVLIFVFGIHITGLVPFELLFGEKKIKLHSKPSGYLGSFLVGLVFAAGWTPCIGPVLASILMVAATEEKVVYGVTLLLVYSLGLGIPFILSSLAMHHFLIIFNRFKRFIRIFEISTGIFLMLLGIIIYQNWLSRISGYSSNLFGGV